MFRATISYRDRHSGSWVLVFFHCQIRGLLLDLDLNSNIYDMGLGSLLLVGLLDVLLSVVFCVTMRVNLGGGFEGVGGG